MCSSGKIHGALIEFHGFKFNTRYDFIVFGNVPNYIEDFGNLTETVGSHPQSWTATSLLWRVSASGACVCVCVCGCVYVRARARACVCVYVYVSGQL